LNVSWSPLNYDSISFIIASAANTKKITISVSPYTYNLLRPADFELAASKNIVIELLTTNYVEDKRLSAIVTNGDGSKVLGNDGTYKTLPTKTSQLENDSNFLTKDTAFSGKYSDLTDAPNISKDAEGNVVATDSNGNTFLRSRGKGIETSELFVENIVINGMTIQQIIQSYVNQAVSG
jgi:hypothetical protein